MQIDARLTFNKVRFDQDADAHLVVSLTAPTTKVEDTRPPLCIVPLLDLSSSMDDNNKLVYAKKSLIKLIDHLSPNDYCGLVTFSYQAKVIQKPVRCTVEAKEDLKRKVGGLVASGTTNIGDALLEGFKLANDMDLAMEVLTRVILFTDGAANAGPAKTPADILSLVAPNIGIASISAFGYGSDAQQDFLHDLSKSGKGNYSFVQNPDDALSAFGKELGGLLSTYGTNLVVEVAPLAGHQIVQVVSDVEADEEALGQVAIKIPDILAEETRHLVMSVKLQAQKNAFPREVNVVGVKLTYDTLDANMKRERITVEAKAKVQFVKEGEEQTAAEPDLDRIVGLAQIVRAQIEAEEHAKAGEFKTAAAVMSNMSAHIGTRSGLADLGAVARGMSQRLGSRREYVSSSSYFTSFASGATRGVGGTYDVSAAADLQAAGVSLCNSAQAATEASFADDAGEAESSGEPESVAGIDLGSVQLPWNPFAGSTLGDSNLDPSVTIGDPVDLGGSSDLGPSVTIGDPVGSGPSGWVDLVGSGPSGWVNQTVGLVVPSVTAPQPRLPAINSPFLVSVQPMTTTSAPEPKPTEKAKGKKRKIAQKSTRW